MAKENLRKLELILTIIIGLVGLVTVIFAILNMANVSGVKPDVVLIYIFGVTLLLCGLIFLLVGIVAGDSDPKVGMVDLIIASVLLGFGLFSLIGETSKILQNIVGLLLPIVIACFGFALTIRGVVSIAQKKDQKKGILVLILGIISLAVGIVFAIFSKDGGNLYNVLWLLIGLSMTGSAIIALVNVIKENKRAHKEENKVVEAETKEKK